MTVADLPTVPRRRIVRCLGRTLAILVSAAALAALVWNPFRNSEKETEEDEDAHAIRIVACDSDSLVVEHWGGVTRVPRRAQRICALQFADELLALGVLPIAVSTDWRGRPSDYLEKPLQGVRPVPNIYGDFLPSFEAIVECRPDLIVTCAGNLHTYEQLSRIAPTIVLRDQGAFLDENRDLNRLKRRLRDLAAILDRQAEAERAIAAFDGKVAAARGFAAERAGGKTIAFFRTRGREWRLYGRHGACGAEAIYDALKIDAPEMVAEKGTGLDPEKLVRFDADYLIIVADRTPGAGQTMNRLRAHPLWRRVTAVREGHVLELTTYRHWILSGLVGKARMIDEVLECLDLGDEAEIAGPGDPPRENLCLPGDGESPGAICRVSLDLAGETP